MNKPPAKAAPFDAQVNVQGVLLQHGDVATMQRGATATLPDAGALAIEMALRQGKQRDALALCKQALQCNANNIPLLGLYGSLLQQLEQYPQAIRVLKKALSLVHKQATVFSPVDRANWHIALGMSLRHSHRLPDAIDAFEQAHRLLPDNPAPFVHMGLAWRESGFFDEAKEAFEAAIGRNSKLPEAWNGLIRCHHFTTLPENLEGLKAVCEQGDLPPKSLQQGLYALGRIHDMVGAYDEAFAWYVRANDARSVPAGAIEECAQMEQIMAASSSGTASVRCESARTEEGPSVVFILGLPRSGTTLVEQIIATHPNALGGGELNYFESLANTLKAKAVFPDALDTLTDKQCRGYAKDFITRFKEHTGVASLSKKRVITDKTPFNFMYLELIVRVFPNAKIIHCRRDVRDTGLSIYFTNFTAHRPFSTSLDSIADYTVAYGNLMAHWRAAPPLPMLEVDYETLVRSGEESIRKLIDFCALRWDDTCLAFHKNHRHISTPSDWQVRQELYDDSIGRWRHYEGHLERFLATLKCHTDNPKTTNR